MRGRKFVVGDSVTVADFALAYTLDWAKLTNLLNGLPQLEAYLEQMYARPRAPMRLAAALALTGLGRETAPRSDAAVP
jgi:glutathione S-transferase